MYTLQGRETPEKGSGTFVMAFARQEEASRFSMLLQAQGFGMPTASAWSSEELSDFCMTADFGAHRFPLSLLPSFSLSSPSPRDRASSASSRHHPCPPPGLGFVPHGALVFPPEDNYFDADAFAKHKSQEVTPHPHPQPHPHPHLLPHLQPLPQHSRNKARTPPLRPSSPQEALDVMRVLPTRFPPAWSPPPHCPLPPPTLPACADPAVARSQESEDAWGTEGAEVRRGLDRLFEL